MTAAGSPAYSTEPASAIGMAAHLTVLVGLDPWREGFPAAAAL